MKKRHTLSFVLFAALAFVGLAQADCTPAKTAEQTYEGELLACTAQALLTDAGYKGSKACERDVDQRWHVTAEELDGGAQ